MTPAGTLIDLIASLDFSSISLAFSCVALLYSMAVASLSKNFKGGVKEELDCVSLITCSSISLSY